MIFPCSMGLFLSLLLGVAGAAPQQPPAPPPSQAGSQTAVSAGELTKRRELLSSRVTELYELYRIPSWRRAEAYVTEESRDIFYELPKGPILGFTVKKLEVQPDAKRAQAFVEIKFVMAGFPEPMFLLQKTQWVYEHDNWFMKLERPPQNPLAPLLAGQPASAFKDAVLRFQELEQEVAPGKREYVFPFQNFSKETLTVKALADECNCMEVTLSKQSYAPGERGEVRVKIDIGEKAKRREFYIQLLANPGGHWIALKLRGPDQTRLP